MLSHSKLSKDFWGEVLNTAVHLINRSPSHALDDDISEMIWKGKDMSYDHLRVFVVGLLCTYSRMKGQNLIARPMSVFSWGMKMVNSDISCCGILLRIS
jgi:hypothetical protein